MEVQDGVHEILVSDEGDLNFRQIVNTVDSRYCELAYSVQRVIVNTSRAYIWLVAHRVNVKKTPVIVNSRYCVRIFLAKAVHNNESPLYLHMITIRYKFCVQITTL